MTKYWCVNFDSRSGTCLQHGLHRKLWMMQYQYADDEGHVFQDGKRRPAITKNWRRMNRIEEGDRFVAYLPGNKFYAVGTVIPPRVAKSSQDSTGTIEDYLARKRSHDRQTGRVYYTPVFYEDFTDNWRHPNDPLSRYAQRIDVDEWQHYVPNGVSVKGLNAIRPYELQMAAFQITKGYFGRIVKKLEAEHGELPKSDIPGGESKDADDAVVEILEKKQAEGQGFVLDSKLRKALEDYAMNAAKRHFKAEGYKCEDLSNTNPYDLRGIRDQEVLYIEVKGTQTDGDEIFLTFGEVKFARSHKGQMALFVLHSIQVAEGESGFVLTGGERHLIRPWDLDQGTLVPMSFRYGVPDGKP